MIENRIKELRKSRGLNQTILADIIGTSQQSISSIENGKKLPSIDIVINVAKYFNVTTDYLLGVSTKKRDLECQMKMDAEIEQYYDIVMSLQELDEINQEIVKEIIKYLLKSQNQRMIIND